MKNTRVWFALAVSCLALGCERKPATPELETTVRGFCTNAEQQLKVAAEKHRQLATAIDDKRLTDDQLQRANEELASISIGNTVDTRRARVLDFESRLQFCLRVRAIEQTEAAQYAETLERLREGLNQDVMSGAMPTAAKTAELLEQMQALAHEVNARPFKR